jgi:hypothetical protein
MTAMMRSLFFALLAITYACTMHAAPAWAQAARTFVSEAGSDSNNCTNVATPCRHFAAAFAATAVNGEIYVLDPANYGSLAITHAVSIQGHGWGSISPVSGGMGITIDAPSTDAVNLDGLTIDGAQIGVNGILFNSGKSLTVENCVVRNMELAGLDFFSSATTLQTLSVSNSYFSDNGSGIQIETLSSGAVTASIDRTKFYRNSSEGLVANGFFGTGALTVAVTDSVAANNPGVGIGITSNTGKSVVNLSVTHSLMLGNGQWGLAASGFNTMLWLAQSTVTGNASSFVAVSGGIINSYGDNDIGNSNTASIGSLTPVTMQ